MARCRERKGASFKVNEVLTLLAGGPENVEFRARVTEAVKADPAFSKVGKYGWDRAELYKRTLKAQFSIPRVVGSLGALARASASACWGCHRQESHMPPPRRSAATTVVRAQARKAFRSSWPRAG